MNKRHYEHTLPNIRGSLSNTYLSAVITGTCYPADTDKVYCALYDDLIKKADSKETLSEKDSLTGALAASHIICYYEDFSLEMQRIRMSATPCTNIRKMI